jgi:hypothetical protein
VKEKKDQAEKVKAYQETAKRRLEKVFFTRPEWRHPKNAAHVNVIVGRIDEVYYPFSDRDKQKAAIWKIMLKDLKLRMLDELESATKAQSTAQRVSSAVAEAIRERSDLIPQAHPAAWNQERIAELRARIKAKRGMAKKIAGTINVTPRALCCLLKGRGYSPKTIGLKLDLVERELGLAEYGDGKAAPAADDGAGKPEPNHDRSIVDYPQQAATLISNMSVDVKDGKLIVQVHVDIAAAIRMHQATAQKS